ncbi:hypothetical protein C8F01DRAFT_552368 [Mycena amicta]|nr:hypothetical protein C8F01DRAFT_552368 [Mycena amicta]
MTSTPIPRFVPAAASFAVLRLDPDASLAHLNDPQATLAATALELRDYVVYLPSRCGPLHPSVPFRQEEVEFVLQGHPVDVPDECIDAAMCLPIFPATVHSASRAPLMPTGDFPWSNCYLAPFAATTVRCPTVRAVDPVVCKLSSMERARHNSVFCEDEAVRRDKFEALHPAESEEESDCDSVLSYTPGDVMDDASQPSVFTFAPRGDEVKEPSDEEKSQQEEAEIAELMRTLILPREAPDDMITVTFTHDLSRVKTLNDPRGFFHEMEEISRIVQESLARKMKKAEEDGLKLDHRTETYLRLVRAEGANGRHHTSLPSSSGSVSGHMFLNRLRSWRNRIRRVFCK